MRSASTMPCGRSLRRGFTAISRRCCRRRRSTARSTARPTSTTRAPTLSSNGRQPTKQVCRWPALAPSTRSTASRIVSSRIPQTTSDRPINCVSSCSLPTLSLTRCLRRPARWRKSSRCRIWELPRVHFTTSPRSGDATWKAPTDRTGSGRSRRLSYLPPPRLYLGCPRTNRSNSSATTLSRVSRTSRPPIRNASTTPSARATLPERWSSRRPTTPNRTPSWVRSPSTSTLWTTSPPTTPSSSRRASPRVSLPRGRLRRLRKRHWTRSG
mmetsp:Transcript_18248/g.47664  ORF Transcript_18248/g.47664 Transcript_18248/m.47664 type:complete len:269 (-) Transcript_18248:1003-1809(-)